MKSFSGELDPKFRAFLEAAPDAFVMVDEQGRIVAVNALTEAMFGYARDELRGQSVELLVPKRFRASHGRNRAAYMQAPHTRPMGAGRDLWGRRKSGEEFPVEISLSPIETEGGTLVTSIIRDITTQRHAEARFRGLLEAAPDGIIVVDANGTIVIVNSQTERMFGYTRQELIGQAIEIVVPDRWRGRHVGDRNSYVDNPVTRPMGAGRTLTGRTKDGSELPVEISLSPLYTEEGMLVMSIVRDITERRKAEELIQASLREKEALLKEIHHRVKNNLQITSSLLRLQSGSIEDERIRGTFEETQSRIRSMALVHEKLYQSSNLARIDFGDYIRSLGELLFHSFAVDRRRIALEVAGEKVFVSIETAVPCALIVNELLTNALKHAYPGRRSGTIRVQLAVGPDEGVSLTIADEGVGLPRDLDVPHASTLGLRLVHALVEQIDGRLSIDRSGPTAFTIAFPGERAK
ncbi:MAG TPA: PAS domain S-box protein [Thermoanaerobaculia bacterium]|nr:PAS domain S-box protein [Thermoanaerobaculia bacterium]